eukprot:TRINITY_DN3436_c0_g6_i1.p1 TRINITY_DN3436_c0_g6~~TRINITY_DN3436_c0_g6_i1.p1  ORF type:complete len:355 (+),score=139.35 TRINITY_DN3436_c0_g6_i1:44-1066(+)
MPGTRALMCAEIKADPYSGIAAMQLVDREKKALKKGDVRVAVKSAALNFPELLMLQNKYQFKPKLPFVMCTEGAGVVTESNDPQWQAGDRVFFSSMIEGTCQEEWVGKGKELFRLPKQLTFSQGAGFMMGYATGYHALVHRGHLKAGEWLMVTGAGGGMGVAAVQLGKVLGAKVIAAASSDDKLEVCKQAGADYTINYGKEDLKKAVSKITKGKMCDVIYEPVGGDIFDQCVRCVATAGGARLLVVGFASGRIPKLPANMALIKGFDLVGVRMGHQLAVQPGLRDELFGTLLQMANEGKLAPVVTAEYPLEHAKDAFKLMADRKVIGKVCITMDGAASKL